MRWFSMRFRSYGAGPSFFCVSSYKDVAPTEPFQSSSRPLVPKIWPSASRLKYCDKVASIEANAPIWHV
jgi:hypothetical protein